MKFLFFAFAVLLCHFSASAQIKPNTVMCIKGSDAHPQTYCADPTPCKQIVGPNETHTVCLAGTVNPPPGALIHTSSCWSRTTEYTCLEYVSSCAKFTSDQNCNEQGSRTCTTDAESQLLASSYPKLGQCAAYTRTFSCLDPRKDSSSSYTKTTQCDVNGTMNGLDWSTSRESSASDFVLAVTGQEFARQLALYGSKDGGAIDNLFPGHPLGCREGYMGLKSCCKSSGGGAASNNSMAKNTGLSIGMGALQQGAGYAAAKGSMYVFDTIITHAPEFLTPGVDAMLSAGANNMSQFAGFGAFGIGSTAEAAGGLFFGSTSSVAIGNTGLYFNPYALAAAIAIQIVMEVLSCDQDEMDLARARSQNLCHSIGSYCSTKIKVLGVTVGCAETTDMFCCYNGQLGKAVAEGSHAQLGLSWGSPESPICRGLTVAQLTALDFNSPAMLQAMEPFKQEIMKGYEKNIAPNLTSGAVNGLMSGKADTNSKSLCLQRQKMDPKTVCN